MLAWLRATANATRTTGATRYVRRRQRRRSGVRSRGVVCFQDMLAPGAADEFEEAVYRRRAVWPANQPVGEIPRVRARGDRVTPGRDSVKHEHPNVFGLQDAQKREGGVANRIRG